MLLSRQSLHPEEIGMKHILPIVIIFVISCSGKPFTPDLQSKAVYSADIILQDNQFYGTRKPFALYFKKIQATGNLKDGTIIKSAECDEKGNIAINGEPGAYTIIAAATYGDLNKIVIIFNEETMNRLKVELKAGEIRTSDKIHIMFSNNGMTGKTDDVQMYNLEQISKTLAFMPYEYRTGYLDRVLYPSESPEK